MVGQMSQWLRLLSNHRDQNSDSYNHVKTGILEKVGNTPGLGRQKHKDHWGLVKTEAPSSGRDPALKKPVEND